MSPRDTFLYAPFLGWFIGLPGALRDGTLGDPAYTMTWLLTMPFAGWFVVLWLTWVADPLELYLRMRVWP